MWRGLGSTDAEWSRGWERMGNGMGVKGIEANCVGVLFFLDRGRIAIFGMHFVFVCGIGGEKGMGEGRKSDM